MSEWMRDCRHGFRMREFCHGSRQMEAENLQMIALQICKFQQIS
jgi:hypothetical protein